MNQEEENRLKSLRLKRPKEGTYPTFTVAARGETRLSFQKARYESTDKRGSRTLVDDRIPVTIQRGVEFDVYRECLGSKDGKIAPNAVFLKLVVTGYKSEGKPEFLVPDELQKFLEDKLASDTNRIILWKDRPRPENEKALEKALEAKDAIISARDTQTELLRKLLNQKGVKNEDIEAALAKAD